MIERGTVIEIFNPLWGGGGGNLPSLFPSCSQSLGALFRNGVEKFLAIEKLRFLVGGAKNHTKTSC